MLIKSQDRRAIVNLDKLKTIELDRDTNFKSIIIFRETNEVETGVCGLFIGHYDTEERAKEVLQEIVKAYKFNINFKYNKFLTEKEVIEMQNDLVYEMPEK